MDYLEIVNNEPGNENGATIVFDKVGVADQTEPTSADAIKKLKSILEVCNTCSASCGRAMIVRWIHNDAIIAQGTDESTFEQGGAARCINSEQPPYLELPHIGNFDER